MNWITRNRDRLLFLAGLAAAAVVAYMLTRGWATMGDPGEPVAPSGWRSPERERLQPEFVSNVLADPWSIDGRDPFREVATETVGGMAELEPPGPPPPTAPLPPPATGALRTALAVAEPAPAPETQAEPPPAAGGLLTASVRLPPGCKLEVIEDDMVLRKGAPSYYVGEIVSETDTELVLRMTTGITASFNKAELADVKRKTSVEGAYQKARQEAGADAEKQYALGVLCMDCNLLDHGVEQFEEAIRLNPGLAKPYEALGAHYREKEDFNGELSVGLKAAEAVADPVPFLVRNAEVYEALGLAAKAVQEYQKAIQAQPAAIEPRLKLAELHLSRQQLTEAATLFGEVLGLSEHHTRALDGMGRVELLRGDLESARKFFQRAAVDPALPHPQNGLGAVAQLEGRLDRAQEAYDKALQIAPDFAYSLINVACLQAASGSADGGRNALARVQPGAAETAVPLLLAMGYLAEKLQEPETAATHYLEALKLQPDSAYARCGVGRVLLLQGERDQAGAQFHAARLFDPDSRAALHGEACVAALSEDYPAARKAVGRWLELQPDSATALAFSGLLDLRERYRANDARTKFEQALKLDPKEPAALNGMAHLSYRSGDRKHALEYLEQAVQAGDPTGYADTTLAEIQAAEGESYWSDNFDRAGGDASDVLRGWTEQEGEGILIRVAQNRLRFDGIRQGQPGRTSLLRLEKDGDLLRIEVTLEMADVNEATIGLRIGTKTGELIFGVEPDGRLVYASSDSGTPKEVNFIPITVSGNLAAGSVLSGERMTLRIEALDHTKGLFQLYGRSRDPLLPTPIEARRMARAKDFEVGLVALTPAGRQCRVYADSFKVVRRKAP